jgi:general secretion pathway protein F
MQYRVNAVNARREVISLSFDAGTEAGAMEAARSAGLTVISMRAKGPSAMTMPALRAAFASAFPVLQFSIELMALLDAGLNLVEAVTTLKEKESVPERQEVLSQVLSAIRRGESFSRAVGGLPQHFSPLYVATLKASERTGNVPEALSRYIAYQQELERVKKKIVAASIYPAILMAVGSLVLAFLVFYVVPRFARVYDGMTGTLPFFSEVLLNAGRGIERHGGAIALASAALAALLVWAVARPAFRAWFNTFLWGLPGIGPRMKTYQLARLYRTAGMLLRAGIPALQALQMSGGLLTAHLREQLGTAARLVAEGKPMSMAFSATGLATPVALRMMAVGERSGDMGEMLGQIARFHDEQTARDVEWFTRAFEPLLMTALGIAVGVVVVLMYMPIFELAGSLN